MEYVVTWQVRVGRRAWKNVERMPIKAQASLQKLLDLLRVAGPTGPKDWKNYGKIKGRDAKYHCHLTSDHQWVACWQKGGDTLFIEVYYVGSHQGAPY
jgi:hypothetical protein